MQKAKQKATKLFKDRKKIQREKKRKECAMVAFNPRFFRSSKCQQPQNYICLYMTTGFSSGLREEKKKKRGEDSRIFCTFHYFCPFPQCVRKQPCNGVSLLCLLLSLFEWVHIFLGWKSGAQSWFKEKKNEGIFCVI